MWTGEQISMDGFRRRSFYATRIPGLDIQVTNTEYSDATGPLEKFLQSKKWISPTKVKMTDDDWLIVHDTKGTYSWEGDSRILTSYLNMVNGEDAINLLKWSQENQELAALLWPEVEQAGRVDQFYLIPDMIHLMLDFSKKEVRVDSKNQKVLQESADMRHELAKRVLYPHLTKQYEELAAAFQAAGEVENTKLMKQEAQRTAEKKSPLAEPPNYSVSAKIEELEEEKKSDDKDSNKK